MRKTQAVVLAILAAALACGCRKAEWARYNSAEGRYSVLFRGTPNLGSQQATAASGEKTTQYMATAAEAGAAYSVIYFDVGPGMTFSFDGARDGMVKAIQGTLLSERPLTLDGSPGREVKIQGIGRDGRQYVSVARYYEVSGRVYIVQFVSAASAQGPANDQEAATFLDSFQVTKAP